ncbi:hypothetical protein BROUX41_001857 [Berkeleyomyces rouxiae]|uniref:uncharacterized protein n=1 Tax=Berkeleyomyces rouxiae TaxID=2035830 RepID=UPI003B778FF5
MFYHGSLQEGIASAVQRNKTVVCFVTDEQEESKVWEDDFLVDQEISDVLRNEAIALRLAAGSEEAGYLAAIFPLPKTPTLVILKNGELKEYISAGASKEVFLQRTLNSFGRKRKPTPEPATSSPTSDQSAAGIIAAALSAASSPVIRASSSRGPSPPPSYSTSQLSQAQSHADDQAETQSHSPLALSLQQSPIRAAALPDSDVLAAHQPEPESQSRSQPVSSAQQILAERAARISAQRAEEARAAKARAANSSSSPASTDPAPAPSTPLTASQSDHVSSIQRQRAAELAEKKRILQQIEDDKLARRQRAADRSAAKLTTGSVAAALASAPSSSISRASNAAMAALQVRLEDGSSLRSRFARDATLAGDVRPWIARERAAQNLPDAAYHFKLVLTPQPNRLIDAVDEDKPLHALGLTPSATLVLVPSPGAASAYPGSAGGASAGGPLSYILAFFTWLSAMVYTFLGIGATAPSQAAEHSPGSSTSDTTAASVRESGSSDLRRRRQQAGSSFGAPGASTPPAAAAAAAARRIHGFESGAQRRDDAPPGEHQLYNGNSTNFEPRPDDE